MDLHLVGKRALVTASTGGIGRESAVSLAREGAHVIVNGLTQASVDAALKYISAKVPASSLEGVVADIGTAEGVAHTIAEVPGVDILVIKRGPDGAEIIREHGSLHIPAISERPVDPTGAGDAFCGGFLAGLLDTDDPREAALRGAVSASFVVETHHAPEALRVIDTREAHRRADRTRAELKELA